MKWPAVVLSLAACATESSETKQTYLPSDATFIRDDVPSCLQQYPDNASRGYPCCQLLTFYVDGEAVKDSGEEGFPGKYTLDGPVARGTIFGRDFVFDFTTNIATGGLVDGQWLADTENLAASACHP